MTRTRISSWATVGSRGFAVGPGHRLAGSNYATRLDARCLPAPVRTTIPILEWHGTRMRTGVRLVLEGSRRFAWDEGRVLTPTVEVGLRRDWGDAETGLGIEARRPRAVCRSHVGLDRGRRGAGVGGVMKTRRMTNGACERHGPAGAGRGRSGVGPDAAKTGILGGHGQRGGGTYGAGRALRGWRPAPIRPLPAASPRRLGPMAWRCMTVAGLSNAVCGHDSGGGRGPDVPGGYAAAGAGPGHHGA